MPQEALNVLHTLARGECGDGDYQRYADPGLVIEVSCAPTRNVVDGLRWVMEGRL
jgi:hypothetical protein